MVYSMTGYGRGMAAEDGREITIELKSVNHRYLDIGMRLPRHITFLEDIFRSVLKEMLSRGHVDVFVNYRNTRKDAKIVKLDEALLMQYILAGKEAALRFSVADDLTLSNLLRLPDVVEIVEADEDRDVIVALAEAAAKSACRELIDMRKREGERMYADLDGHMREVETLVEHIALRAPMVVQEYREKLNERISQIVNDVELDRARLSTEIALFADRASIDEELARLKSHIAQFRATMNNGEPAGRRLDFIVQEIHREFNTIGSKANDADLTNAVLSGKGEVEKLREQVQNIE